MGADGSAYVVLGIGVTKTTFFVTTPGPPQCTKGHKPSKTTSNFCDQCGARLTASVEDHPTPEFDAWSKRLGLSPDELWEILNEDEGGVNIGTGKKNQKFYAELGIHPVAAIESSEGREGYLALGFRLLDQEGEGNDRGNSPNTYPVEDEFMEKAQFLRGLAKELKLDAFYPSPVTLHLTYYWSV